MSGTLKNGYYNIKPEPDGPGCWWVYGSNLYFIYPNGRAELESKEDSESRFRDLHSGDLVPSLWLPPGVTHNPAMGLLLDPKYQGRFTKKGFEDGLVWYVTDDQVMYKYLGDTDKSRDFPTLEAFKDAVDRGELFRVDEKPAFFETVEEAEASLEAEPTQASPDDHEAASRFINLEAMEVVSYIALECSWKAGDQVRRVFTTPSQLDRAIAARVVELLS